MLTQKDQPGPSRKPQEYRLPWPDRHVGDSRDYHDAGRRRPSGSGMRNVWCWPWFQRSRSRAHSGFWRFGKPPAAACRPSLMMGMADRPSLMQGRLRKRMGLLSDPCIVPINLTRGRTTGTLVRPLNSVCLFFCFVKFKFGGKTPAPPSVELSSRVKCFTCDAFNRCCTRFVCASLIESIEDWYLYRYCQ